MKGIWVYRSLVDTLKKASNAESIPTPWHHHGIPLSISMPMQSSIFCCLKVTLAAFHCLTLYTPWNSWYWHNLTEIISWVIICIPYFLYDVITHPCTNFGSDLAHWIWVWMGLYILKNTMDMITYACHNVSRIVFEKNDHKFRSWNCGCLVTWFCYQLIAKPGNKTAAVFFTWPMFPFNNTYIYYIQYVSVWDCCATHMIPPFVFHWWKCWHHWD